MKNFLKIMTVAILLAIVTMSCQDKNVTGVTLDKDTLTLTVGETETLIATVLPNDATNQAVTWASSNQTVATVLNGKVTAVKAGTATITVTTAEGGFTATCAVTVIPKPDEPDPDEWIMIDGIKWATRNVDAPGTFAAKPENAGMFYQWSRKTGWSSTDPLVNHEDGTTWNNIYPNDAAWGAANDPCPSGWRVPTHEEQQSLVNSGYSEMTTLNGVTGRYFGNGNNKVFFPAAGFRLGMTGNLTSAGNYGAYWSSTRVNEASAYSLNYNNMGAGTSDPEFSPGTITGYSVRCVKQ